MALPVNVAGKLEEYVLGVGMENFLSALRPFLNATATKKCDFAPETGGLTSLSHHFFDC
jgi:hypothetical protein